MKKDVTIEEIEKFEGIEYDNTCVNQAVLPKWYENVRRKKLSQLSDGDLARFVRQGMYLEFIIYECVNRLYKNPYSGEKFDGEILEALSKVKDSFWRENEACKNYMSNFLVYFNLNVAKERFEQLDDFEKEEILSYINQLRKKIL